MFGTVSMVHCIVSLSGSAMLIVSWFVVVHTLVLVFAGLGVFCVGSLFAAVVNLYQCLVHVHPSLLLTYQLYIVL